MTDRHQHTCMGLPDGSVGKESACNAGDMVDTGPIPGLGRFPGEGNGNSLQYSCLENPLDRGAWKVQPRGSQRDRHDSARRSGIHTHTYTCVCNTWRPELGHLKIVKVTMERRHVWALTHSSILWLGGMAFSLLTYISVNVLTLVALLVFLGYVTKK